MKLLHKDGAPIGITFRKHKQNQNSYVLRVTGDRQMTDIGVNANNMPECFEKAIDKRLELLGMTDNAEAFTTLASSYGAFLERFGITLKPVIAYEFQIKGE